MMVASLEQCLYRDASKWLRLLLVRIQPHDKQLNVVQITTHACLYAQTRARALEEPLFTSSFLIAFIPFQEIIGVSLKFFNSQKLSKLFYFCIHLGDLHI